MSIPVYIAIYKPRSGNYYHWSIFIDADLNHLYEVSGEHPNFQYNHVNENPASSGHHKENILVGYITPSDLPGMSGKLQQVTIDNDNPGWCCQDWVLEALEELCNDFVLDEDDEDYKAGVKRAKRKYFGPI